MKVDRDYNQAVKIDLDAKIKNQVLYAAAFICPGILSTSYEDGKFNFRLDRTVPCEDLKAGLGSGGLNAALLLTKPVSERL